MTTSGKFIATLFISAFAIASCGKEEQPLTPVQIKARADSIYQSSLKKIQQRAREDYEKRLPIELKPKVDSILQRKMEQAAIPVFPEDDVELTDSL